MSKRPSSGIVKTEIIKFRATPDLKRLLEAVASKFGENQSAAMAYLITEYAERNKIKAKPAPEKPDGTS